MDNNKYYYDFKPIIVNNWPCGSRGMKWIIKEPIQEDYIQQHSDYGLSKVALQLLYNRELKTSQEIDSFLHPDYSKHLHDPFLLLNSEKVIARILKAVKLSEKIIIYGDYDSDGICSSVVISSVLDKLGAKNYEIFLPHRDKDGYGLSLTAVEKIITKGAKVVITLDCGTSNIEEAARLAEVGIDLIIIDHHIVGKTLPQCHALINPKQENETYPFKNLATVGLAYKVSQGLLSKSDLDPVEADKFLKWLLDLVAIATVTDLMPLLGENRVLLKYGLVVVNKTRRLGLKQLIKLSRMNGNNGNNNGNNTKNSEITAYHIGFRIGPRINAASRVGHADTALNLLRSTDVDEAETLSQNLENHNTYRRDLVTQVAGEVFAKIETFLLNNIIPKILVVFHEQCTAGIAGLIASKVVDKYNRPALVLGKNEAGFIGSGRSVPGFHITNAMANVSALANQPLLVRYGGHDQACGFTLRSSEDTQLLSTLINEYADNLPDIEKFEATLDIESEVALQDLNLKLCEELSLFEPHGNANFKPKFVVYNVVVLYRGTVGNGKHLTLVVQDTNQSNDKRCIGFGFGYLASEIQPGDILDLVFEFELDQWNGRQGVQLILKSIRKNNKIL